MSGEYLRQEAWARAANRDSERVINKMLEALIAAEKKLCIAEHHLDKGEDDSVVFESEILLVRDAIALARDEVNK